MHREKSQILDAKVRHAIRYTETNVLSEKGSMVANANNKASTKANKFPNGGFKLTGEAEQILRFSVGGSVICPKNCQHDLPSAEEAFLSCCITEFQERDFSQKP